MLHCLSDSAWADGNLAEAAAAGQLGKMVEHRNQSQPNPGLSSLGTPCTPRDIWFLLEVPLVICLPSYCIVWPLRATSDNVVSQFLPKRLFLPFPHRLLILPPPTADDRCLCRAMLQE